MNNEQQFTQSALTNTADSLGLTDVADAIDPQGRAQIEALEYFCAEIGRELETVQRERLELWKENQQLLAVAKENHGYNDPLHLRAMPECWQCAVIRTAEVRYE